MTGEQDEIAALRAALRARTQALEIIAKGPAVDEDAETFAKQAQQLAQAALTGKAEQ